jgi:hypothetical protein
MREIPLTKGYVAIVDDEDYERVMAAGKWHYSSGYAVRDHSRMRMHRFIMGLVFGDGKNVDHINGNGLDNRRCNLRICTMSQNQGNRGVNKNNATRYKGVSFDHINNKYMARITIHGRTVHLGRFVYAIDAACAYDRAAREYFGEFAVTNF